MKALLTTTAISGYAIHATDGDIGKVREFYFDDRTWAIRYLVVDMHKWLPGRRVLLAPVALQAPDSERRVVPVSVTKEQVRESPVVDTDKPIARQYQARLHRHYGWDLYWAGEALIGARDIPVPVPGEPVNKDGTQFDPRLRTTRVVGGHRLQATDGAAGHVADFIVDDAPWCIRYLVIDIGRKQQVLLVPRLVKSISFGESKVYADVAKSRVLECPVFDSSHPLTRAYEESVHRHYGTTPYWAA